MLSVASSIAGWSKWAPCMFKDASARAWRFDAMTRLTLLMERFCLANWLKALIIFHVWCSGLKIGLKDKSSTAQLLHDSGFLSSTAFADVFSPMNPATSAYFPLCLVLELCISFLSVYWFVLLLSSHRLRKVFLLFPSFASSFCPGYYTQSSFVLLESSFPNFFSHFFWYCPREKEVVEGSRESFETQIVEYPSMGISKR